MSEKSMSGVYRAQQAGSESSAELRLRDGGESSPSSASGFVLLGDSAVYWYAPEVERAGLEFAGRIEYVTDAYGVPLDAPEPKELTLVQVTVARLGNGSPDSARVALFADGVKRKALSLEFHHPHFREFELRIKVQEQLEPVLRFDTRSALPRPDDLADELSIDDVFLNTGVRLNLVGPAEVADREISDINPPSEPWDKDELHTAMSTWLNDRRSGIQQTISLFFATRYKDEWQTGLMFDSLTRRGAAVFMDSTLFEGQPDSERRREVFFTALHEIGHCLNLGHVSSPLRGEKPWHWQESATQADESRFFSLMNNVRSVQEDPNRFFEKCRFEFAKEDCEFMRHAPHELVQPGAVAFRWRDGGAQPMVAEGMRLQLCGFRTSAEYALLEPPVLQLRLSNNSSREQEIPERVFGDDSSMKIFIAKEDRATPQLYRPYLRHCCQPNCRTMKNNETISESLWIASGLDGWYIREPGKYRVWVELILPNGIAKSNVYSFLVREPETGDNEITERWFSDEVGRVIRLGGTPDSRLTEELADLVMRYPERPFAAHLALPLSEAFAKKYKVLQITDEKTQAGKVEVKSIGPDLKRSLSMAVSRFDYARLKRIAESIGYMRLWRHVSRLSAAYAHEMPSEATKLINAFRKVVLLTKDETLLDSSWIKVAIEGLRDTAIKSKG